MQHIGSFQKIIRGIPIFTNPYSGGPLKRYSQIFGNPHIRILNLKQAEFLSQGPPRRASRNCRGVEAEVLLAQSPAQRSRLGSLTLKPKLQTQTLQRELHRLTCTHRQLETPINTSKQKAPPHCCAPASRLEVKTLSMKP